MPIRRRNVAEDVRASLPVESNKDRDKESFKIGDVKVTSHSFEYMSMEREYLYVHGRLPFGLVTALHPFGGSPERTLDRYDALVKRGFSILLPRGIENSWNAGSCCGKALALGLDDVGFVRAVTAHVLTERFSERPTTKAYLTGFSNGAFLASQVALTALAHGETWIQALALNAGYSYDSHLYRATVENGKVTRETAFPVLALHGVNDTSVRIGGCCSTDAPHGESTCCCQVYSPKCMSFEDSFEKWKSTYQCNDHDTLGTEKVVMVRSGLPQLRSAFDAVCYNATGCIAPIEFCALPGVGHRLDASIPIDHIVSDFFFNDYSNIRMDNTVNKSFGHKHNAGNPHAPPAGEVRHEPIKGYLITFGFIFAFFYVLARAFSKKPLREILPPRTSDRERQALTDPERQSLTRGLE